MLKPLPEILEGWLLSRKYPEGRSIAASRSRCTTQC